jgi:hypothetical protein
MLQEIIKQSLSEFEQKFVNTIFGPNAAVKVWKLKSENVGDYYGPDELKSHLLQGQIKLLEGVATELDKMFAENIQASHHSDNAWYDGLRSSRASVSSLLQEAINEARR